MGQLSGAYATLGRHDEAIALDRQVVEAKSKVLGPANPGTLTTLHNLAVHLVDAGRDEEAAPILALCWRAAAAFTDRSTAKPSRRRSSLAELYQNRGRPSAAEPSPTSSLPCVGGPTPPPRSSPSP